MVGGPPSRGFFLGAKRQKPRTLDHGYRIDPDRQCAARVKGTHHRCKKPAVVDRHSCAYHSGIAGPRIGPLREMIEEDLELGTWEDHALRFSMPLRPSNRVVFLVSDDQND